MKSIQRKTGNICCKSYSGGLRPGFSIRFTFPVLGYSLTGEYTGENEPENYQAWIRYFGRQIEFADQSDNTAPEIVAARNRYTENNIINQNPEKIWLLNQC